MDSCPRNELQQLLDLGLTITQIADELRISPGAVSERISRLSLVGTRRTQRIRSIREARAAGIKSLMLDCPKHGLSSFWIGSKAVRCRKCNSAAAAARRRRVKKILLAEAGGCCLICGYERSVVALEFHHLDPCEKTFGLSQAGITRSLETSRAESAKCVVLCANCHAEVEAGVTELPVQ